MSEKKQPVHIKKLIHKLKKQWTKKQKADYQNATQLNLFTGKTTIKNNKNAWTK